MSSSFTNVSSFVRHCSLSNSSANGYRTSVIKARDDNSYIPCYFRRKYREICHMRWGSDRKWNRDTSSENDHWNWSCQSPWKVSLLHFSFLFKLRKDNKQWLECKWCVSSSFTVSTQIILCLWVVILFAQRDVQENETASFHSNDFLCLQLPTSYV